MNNLKVYTSPLPFSNKQQAIVVPLGASLFDIVNQAMPDRYKQAPVGAVVMIDGEIIPQEYWRRVRPKAGPHNIAVRIVPQGGKGKKNPIAALLSIAVLVAAPALAGAILGPTLAATQVGIGSLTYGGLLGSAIGVVGRLAISALAPPPKPSNAGLSNVNNPTESPTQFIEGAKNSLLPFGVIPVNLGTNRMFPPQGARPYTESQNNDQYVRQIFTYGYGPQVIISDLRIGETSLTEFTDFDIEHRLNGDLHEGTALYSNDVFQEDFSILLSEPDGYSTRTTQLDADEAIIDFTFPQGLAAYNNQGGRGNMRVALEMQYALTGQSPQVWSAAATSYTDYSGANFTFPEVIIYAFGSATQASGGTRIDTIVIDKYSGALSVVRGQQGFVQAQPIPSNAIRIASVTVTTTRESNGTYTTDIALADVRQAALFGTSFEDSNSFVPEKTGSNSASVSGGGLLVNELDILGNQKEALRKSVRVVFPEPGQYDIRVRRITPDTSSDQIFDKAYLSAIKTVKYQSPINLVGLNGTAVRIKATDQLNGALDQFNVIISTAIPDYDAQLDEWVVRPTSNPASIYRYVLQGAPNGKALPDSRINIIDLQNWHTLCAIKGYSYNRVIDFETSVDAVLRDVASAGAASPAIVDGKRTVAVDTIKDDIVQIITPRNSWGYSGEMIYPELPHAFRVQFRNSEKGFIQDERIVYDDGYSESNALKFEALELQSCIFPDLAFKTGRRHIAAARLRPESHSWMMDVENLVAIRGDRVKLEHDVPIIGIGDGRVKEVFTDGGSPEMVTGFTIDDTVTIPDDSTYYVRVRLADDTQIYKELSTTPGSTKSFTFAVPFSVVDAPAAGDLAYFVEAGGEVDLLITRIEPQDDLTARMVGIDYAQPLIEQAENSPIPAFNSKITTPLEFIRPAPPVLLDQQSDESVMLFNSDGSFTPRAVFTLRNDNEGTIQTSVKVRIAGTSVFTNADVLESTPERLVLTGLEDDKLYDIHIRYRRAGSNMFSRALELNNFRFIGASSPPTTPTNFKVNISGDVAYFKWDKNPDIDHSHSIMKFSSVFSGGAYGTAQTLENEIYDTRVELPFIPGTYFLKHVDLRGNESTNPAVIITYNPGIVENAVEIITENPDFNGVKVDVIKSSANRLVLADPDITEGYYYFDNMVDLTAVFPAFVSANVVANGIFINDIFDMDDLFAEPDLFGGGSNDVFLMEDIFETEDIFGIGADAWAIQLEYSTTQTDPANSPVEWSDWQPLEASTIEFWAIRFRIKLETFAQNVSPAISVLSVKVDMPDRIERGEDMEAPAAGAAVEFDPPFKATPAIAITIQDGDANDEIQYVTKGPDGFEFRVFNKTSLTYVDRSYDFIASGYGRRTT